MANFTGLGDKIKDAREFLGWSQSELARRTGLCRSLITMIESGERYPSIRALNTLLDELAIPYYTVFNEEQKQKALNYIVEKSMFLTAEQVCKQAIKFSRAD